jgi:S1-C subfamily serine protease
MRTILACFGSAVLASVLTCWIVGSGNHPQPLAAADGESSPFPRQRDRAPDEPRNAATPLTPDEAVNVAVYDHCNRGVVNISTVTVVEGGLFFGAMPADGNGSGSVLDKQGHILTNFHVVDGARQIQVMLFNEKSFEAETIGADPINDIAILKINAPAEDLFPMELGDSDSLKVGMRVFALGNPFGLFRTMSEGIISSLNRSLAVQANWEIKSIIQIDASINPGNSGGPLLDSRGRLIGMNTAIASKVQQSAGIGFAIPINLIKRVVPELIAHGRVIRGDIGITHVSVTEEGLRIAQLTPNGPAERAGLQGPKITRRRIGPILQTYKDRQAADVITAIDGQRVTSAAEFLSVIETKKPGEVVELTILRENRSMKVKVKLASDAPDELNL